MEQGKATGFGQPEEGAVFFVLREGDRVASDDHPMLLKKWCELTPDYASNCIGHQMIMGYSKLYRAISIVGGAAVGGIKNALRLGESHGGSKTSPALADIQVSSVDVVNARGALR